MWDKHNNGEFEFNEAMTKTKMGVFGNMTAEEFANKTSWRQVLGTLRRMYE